ncbi:hypothetical protein GCM10011345_35520 [Gemmobacter megaterium]|uniref:hypothetical protein n=1 Tax=Gemmobacter megaterium TaxID=1086013 RepID=UPI00118189D1|nr:hypothetical protein [Gemmobacter megaterium]GGE26452.1 hypothetical protein GCM10011345_35520 [Gemmobacter megaterium]
MSDDLPPEHDIADFFPRNMRSQFRDCRIFAYDQVLKRIQFVAPQREAVRSNYRVVFSQKDLRGSVKISLGPSSGNIQIDTAGPVNLDIRMWRSSSLRIGAGTTVNNARIVCDKADVIIGQDGLWSDDILIQSND